MFFLVLGLLFCVLGLGLKPRRASFLVFFILFWALLHGWEREFTRDTERGLLWLLSVVGTCLLAVLLSLWAWKHEQKVARFLRQSLPWVMSAALACLVAVPLTRPKVEHRAMSAAPRAAERLPNVILIIVDTLRADHLSCYHYDRSTSPNIDQLAVNGVLFENAIATSSWTLPSHASMFTGLYPNQHRAQSYWDQLRNDIPTIAEDLERGGYRTGAFSGSFFFTPRQGLARGFDEFGDFSFSPMLAFTQVHYLSHLINLMGMREWVDEKLEKQSAIDINESVIRWIGDTHQPFFLAVTYYEVHEPHSLPQTWRQHFTVAQTSEKQNPRESTLAVSQFPPRIQKRIDEYDGAIAYDDSRLQELVNELGRRRLIDNTLFIVTADHGEGLGEHGPSGHGGALFYPLIHVPLIFYWPQHLPAGLRISRPVSTKDIPATILELLGAPHSKLPGKSLAAFWNGQTPPEQWPKPLSELKRDRQLLGISSSGHGEIKSIVSPELQLILDPRDGPSLYNWQADPQERVNLFLAPSYEAVRAELTAELKKNE
jgi:arylsulfatase A-like enzyme